MATSSKLTAPSGTAARAARKQTHVPLVLVSLVLWLVLLLFQAAPYVPLHNSPWAAPLAVWPIPVALGAGSLLGILLVGATLPRRWWWAPLAVAPLLGGAAGVGGLVAARGADAPQIALGTLLLGAYATTQNTLLPWLVFRARQAGIAVGLVGLTGIEGMLSHERIAGLPAAQWHTYWLAGLLALTLLLLGLSALREELAVWHELALQRVGPVVRSSVRMVLLLCLGALVLGLVPLDALRWQTLTDLYRRSPLAQSAPLSYAGPGGKPLSAPGEPLSLDTPGVQGDAVLLTYDMLGGTPSETSLLAATFDQFDGTRWTQSPAASVVPVSGRLALPKGADLLRARITVERAPTAEVAPLLLGFSQPIEFSVPAQARLLESGTPSPLTIAGWQALGPLGQGTSYTTAAAVLPLDVQPEGSLPPDFAARMTTVPDALKATLAAQAKQWVGDAQTPTEQAQALYMAMKQNLQFDPAAVAPSGVDGTRWFLQQRRGDGLLWASTYVLLGRSLGLPLRLAEGYLPGKFDQTRGHLVVRESDAAVWAQLAVPGAGWLDIFPAASLRLIKTLPKQTPVPEMTPQPARSSPFQLPSLPGVKLPSRAVIGASVALLVLAVLLVLALLLVRWARLGRGNAPVVRLFARVAVLARMAGVELQASDTARTGTAKVARHLTDAQARALGQLNTTYERVSYGPARSRAAPTQGQKQWRRIQGALVRLILTRPWRRAPDKSPRQMKGHTSSQPGIIESSGSSGKQRGGA
jgi:transglutaminase-like putative cysteine protease